MFGRDDLTLYIGHDKRTLVLTNHPDSEPAARLVDRYPRRMAIDNCI